MTDTDFTPQDIPEKPPRKAGAAKGNRNAWKHGGRSAAAKSARAHARAEIVARLPDAADLLVSVAIAEHAHAHLSGAIRNAHAAPNKTNNSIASGFGGELCRTGEGSPGEALRSRGERAGDFSPNKTNNSVSSGSAKRLCRTGEGSPGEALRNRGAPKGNKNALKHGMKSAERRAFKSGLRLFLRRVDAICARVHSISERREKGTSPPTFLQTNILRDQPRIRMARAKCVADRQEVPHGGRGRPKIEKQLKERIHAIPDT